MKCSRFFWFDCAVVVLCVWLFFYWPWEICLWAICGWITATCNQWLIDSQQRLLQMQQRVIRMATATHMVVRKEEELHQ